MRRSVLAAGVGAVLGMATPFLCLYISSRFRIGVGEFPLSWIWTTGVCVMIEPNEQRPWSEILGIAVAINMAVYALVFLVVSWVVGLAARRVRKLLRSDSCPTPRP